jgi:hypothetical protein
VDGPAGACATVCQRFLRLLYDYSQTSADRKCLDMDTIGIGSIGHRKTEISTFHLHFPLFRNATSLSIQTRFYLDVM